MVSKMKKISYSSCMWKGLKIQAMSDKVLRLQSDADILYVTLEDVGAFCNNGKDVCHIEIDRGEIEENEGEQ